MSLRTPGRRPSRRAVPPLVFAAISGLAPLAAAQGPPTVQLRIATLAPENTSWMKCMREIDATVRKETGNAVGFKIYPNGVMGDEPVVLRKIRSGQLHGGGFTGRGLGSIEPALRVMEIPFQFKGYEDVDRARQALDPDLEARVRAAGFTVLGWADVGFVYLFSRRPIATQSDLASAKMWVWEGDPLAEAFFKAVGVVPVPLAITDVVTSLQTRLVDCVYTSPLGCIGLQWFTRVSNYTNVPVTFATGAVVISNASFESVPAQHRDTVLRTCREKFRDLTVRTRKEDAEALAEIEKSGVKPVTVPPQELARFEALGKGVSREQVGKLYPQDLLDKLQAAIK
jgi:TRAP-type C4-dicarboxylate transport system substrate-binding protein